MTTFKIRPYKSGSRSAKALAEELGAKRLKLEGSNYVPREGHTIINWGSTAPFDAGLATFLNDPIKVANATNKATFFRTMLFAGHEEIVPRFWFNQEEIPDDESLYPIVCRTVLSGHSGDGIVIADTPADLVAGCGLYVQYLKKAAEFRVHLSKWGSIVTQRKARKLDVPDEQVNWQVRNLVGGFVFVIPDEEEVPNAVIEVAREALAASGLDFGAVDVIWNRHKEKAHVLEINTAPGLEKRTAELYAEHFKENFIA